MTNPFPHEDSDLDAAITSVFADLRNHKADSKEYADAANQLSKLYKLRNDTLQLHQDAEESERKHELEVNKLTLETDKLALETDSHEYQIEQNDRSFLARISPDTALSVVANLAVALIVVKYERTGVISTQVRHFIKNL